MRDAISSRPVDTKAKTQAALVTEMMGIQRDGGMKHFRATVAHGYVWLEGWREKPDWDAPDNAFEPALVKDTSDGA